MSAPKNVPISRRDAISSAVGAISTLTAGILTGHGVTGCTSQTTTTTEKVLNPMNSYRMPVVYLPHGGGPWPFVDVGIGDKRELDELAAYLKSIQLLPKQPPKALLVVSAHWEEPIPTVMTSESPPMYYDYYGFPPESYSITWPAPGSPQLAQRVRQLLKEAGFSSAENGSRGFDHGTFVPLKLTYPNADIPVIQLSLIRGLDPAQHIALGRAIAPLRDEGIFIVGSGMSYHNLRAFGPRGRPDADRFDAWLGDTMSKDPMARNEALIGWQQAPSARACHPREEHLIPLMVMAGAAEKDRSELGFRGSILGLKTSAFHFV